MKKQNKTNQQMIDEIEALGEQVKSGDVPVDTARISASLFKVRAQHLHERRIVAAVQSKEDQLNEFYDLK